MKRMNGTPPPRKPLTTIDEEDNMDTPFFKRTIMKRPVAKTEEELKNDFQKAMEHNLDAWVQETFGGATVLPNLPLDISVRDLGVIFRESYKEIMEQPKFVIESLRPGNVWTIQPKNELIRKPNEFAPSVQSATMQKRLHTYAAFAGARLMLNALFAGVCGVYASRGKLYFFNNSVDERLPTEKLTVMPEMYVSFSSDGIWSRTMPKLILPNQTRIPIDGNEGTHFTAWMRCRGGELVEVDLCDVDVSVKVHPVETPVQGMGAMAYLTEARMRAIRTKTTETMDRTLAALTKRIRAFKKKQKMKARKKRRKKQKKTP